jgi:hypothetical protein
LKRQNVLKVLFLSLLVSTFTTSCGLIDKSSSPEEPTDSKPSDPVGSDTAPATGTDDLFSSAMNENTDKTAASDTPSNITNENVENVEAGGASENKDELKSLENEFAGTAKKEEPKPEVAKSELEAIKVEETTPLIKEETPPDLANNSNEDAGKVMSYKVQKGETLMQIAFKIYGDVSKWKSIKQMNNNLASSSSALRAGMELKYTAPQNKFVWNPEGTPRLIKTGETLGTISKDVYQTPKKWKILWENNKPLIKNPNVIYAGFTLYYKGNGMANYVEPKSEPQDTTNFVSQQQTEIEDVKVEQAISKLESTKIEQADVIDLTKDVQSAPIRIENRSEKNEEINEEP